MVTLYWVDICLIVLLSGFAWLGVVGGVFTIMEARSSNKIKSLDEMNKEFEEEIREHDDFLWNDGFNRGYEKAMTDMGHTEEEFE